MASYHSKITTRNTPGSGSGIRFLTRRLRNLSGKHWTDLENVLDEFDSMIQRGERPDAFIFSTMFKACANRKPAAVGTAEGLWKDMYTYGVQPNTVVFNSMINVFASGGDLKGAEHYFQLMGRVGVDPDIQTFNSLLHACAEKADVVRALYWFKNLITETSLKPDEHTFNTMIATAANADNAEKGFEFYSLMSKYGVEPNVQTITTVLKLCAQANALERALEMFKSAQKHLRPDTVMWNAMLNVCAKNGADERGLELWNEMRDADVDPDAASVNALLDLCGQRGDFKRLCQVLAEAEAMHISLNEYSLPTLINGCVKAGNADRAFRWFNLFKHSMPCNKVALSNLFRILITDDSYLEMAQRLFHEALGFGLFTEHVMDTRGSLLLAGLPTEVAQVALTYALETLRERNERKFPPTMPLEIITGRGKLKEQCIKFCEKRGIECHRHAKNFGRLVIGVPALRDALAKSKENAEIFL